MFSWRGETPRDHNSPLEELLWVRTFSLRDFRMGSLACDHRRCSSQLDTSARILGGTTVFRGRNVFYVKGNTPRALVSVRKCIHRQSEGHSNLQTHRECAHERYAGVSGLIPVHLRECTTVKWRSPGSPSACERYADVFESGHCWIPFVPVYVLNECYDAKQKGRSERSRKQIKNHGEQFDRTIVYRSEKWN